MPAPVLAAAAAAPIVGEGAKLAGDVVAHIAAALNMSILSSETTTVRKRSTTVTKASLPAWMVVAVPAGLWVLGLGLGVGTDDKGNRRIGVTERPRMAIPFTDTGASSSVASAFGIAFDLFRLLTPF